MEASPDKQIRISTIAKKLNVGVGTIVHLLQASGIEDDLNANSKVPEQFTEVLSQKLEQRRSSPTSMPPRQNPLPSPGKKKITRKKKKSGFIQKQKSKGPKWNKARMLYRKQFGSIDGVLKARFDACRSKREVFALLDSLGVEYKKSTLFSTPVYKKPMAKILFTPMK